MSIAAALGSGWVLGFCANGDAIGDLLEKAEADLAKGSAAVIPIYDNDLIGLVRDATNLIEDDEMGREVAFEFVVVLLVQIGIVDIEISKAGLEASVEIGKEVGDMGAEQV